MEDTTKMVNTVKLADGNIILDEWKGAEFKGELWKPKPIEPFEDHEMQIGYNLYDARALKINELVSAVNWLLERAK